ncbi:MAG: WYL domain-containing protein [Synergistes sp.]|nr:WYL domain-containing protein [Synergistes sp.]
MAYSELIKHFEKTRSSVTEFFVYGFTGTDDIDVEKHHSFYNEHRRVKSWLREFVKTHRINGNQKVRISISGRKVDHNPLYRIFKAKSTTEERMRLYFFLMDILADGEKRTVPKIQDTLLKRGFYDRNDLDNDHTSMVRKNLDNYAEKGLLEKSGSKKGVRYAYVKNNINLSAWRDALEFYSEEALIGVLGSFLLDHCPQEPQPFRFKHKYMLNALDSEQMHLLLSAIAEKRDAIITHRPIEDEENIDEKIPVFPCKIYISTQNGRQYLLCMRKDTNSPSFFRLGKLHGAEIGDVDDNAQGQTEACIDYAKNVWGVSSRRGDEKEHIEMTVRFKKNEQYINRILNREKRCGTVKDAGEGRLNFCADVYDANEMMPWLREFIGRIEDLSCSNETVTETFMNDLYEMAKLYGIDTEGDVENVVR